MHINASYSRNLVTYSVRLVSLVRFLSYGEKWRNVQRVLFSNNLFPHVKILHLLL